LAVALRALLVLGLLLATNLHGLYTVFSGHPTLQKIFAYLFSWPLRPGVAIGILAFVAAYLCVRPTEKPLTRPKRAGYVAVFGMLCIAEIFSIGYYGSKAEQEQKDANNSQIEGFKTIAGGIDASNKRSAEQFSATMDKFGETINTETGGDTFCYVDFSFTAQWENGKQTTKGFWELIAMRVGKYPLRDISVTIFDNIKSRTVFGALRKRDTNNFTNQALDKIQGEMQQAQQASETNMMIGDFAIDSKILSSYEMSDGDVQEFDVLVRSFNMQMLIERVVLRRTNDHWTKAILVELPRKTPWTKIDRDFPRRADGHLDVNWPRLVKGRNVWDH